MKPETVKRYFANGNLWQKGSYLNGKLMYEYSMLNGLLCGLYYWYHNNGSISSIKSYKNNQLNGITLDFKYEN